MARTKQELERIGYELRHGMPNGVAFNVNVNVDFDDLRQLSPEQLAAFMKGCATVLSANPYATDESEET